MNRCNQQFGYSRSITSWVDEKLFVLVYFRGTLRKSASQSGMLGLGLGLKTKFFGLGLEGHGLGLDGFGLGLVNLALDL